MALLEGSGYIPPVWKDIDNLFRRNSGGNVEISEDKVAVRQSIENILLTMKGERPMLRRFGADLERFLWKPMTDSLRTMMISAINKEIAIWDDRAEIQNIDVEQNPEENSIKIYLEVYVPIDNSTFVMSVSL